MITICILLDLLYMQMKDKHSARPIFEVPYLIILNSHDFFILPLVAFHHSVYVCSSFPNTYMIANFMCQLG